ncbi:TetR/AcrR family transcriptional regulator [Herbaspirillum lusitanum]|uniref:TetR/AcrR family transcriptional regulator n=1 Tax=Herbaspirillum lusitanum TaxID=213312 RepID=UPI0003107349|nr:TetR/AcrR family transcriptional regulator [Herbaspirillum lusitanum]
MQQTRGRPRSFDRDEALRLAMQVFWNKGYEGTTMADLTAAIGVKAPSLYAAFGDKNALFREAIDFYSATTAIGPINALKEGKGMREDLHNMLQASVALYADPANGKGCMVVVSAINCAPENAAHAEEMTVRRQKKRQELAKRFRKAQEQNELSADADIDGLADFYTAVLHGLSLSARDGVSCERLANTICHAMKALDAVLIAPKKKRAVQ